jgi:hypothetical protein
MNNRIEKMKSDGLNPDDLLRRCIDKVEFVEMFFGKTAPEGECGLSEGGNSGLCRILQDIEEDLRFISEEVSKTAKDELPS